MIAIIQFKALPGRRFEVKVGGSYCGDMPNGPFCAFFSDGRCQIQGVPGSTVCLNGYYFEEVVSDNQEK